MEIFGTLALLACPVGMLAMMWFMSRGRGARDSASRSTTELRAERSALDAQIARTEQIAREQIAGAEQRDVAKGSS